MGRKKVRRTGKGGKIIQGKKVQNKNAKCGIVRKNQGIKCRNEKSPCIQAKKNERKNYENIEGRGESANHASYISRRALILGMCAEGVLSGFHAQRSVRAGVIVRIDQH